MEFGQGSQVNISISVLRWLMIYPMMLKVEFGSLGGIARRPNGLMVILPRELPGQAFQHGLACVDFHAACFPRVDSPGDGEEVHRRPHHPRVSSLRRDGFRLALSHRRRRGRTRSSKWP
jgi:hypothetical protein